jgi:hypothetical protein
VTKQESFGWETTQKFGFLSSKELFDLNGSQNGFEKIVWMQLCHLAGN